jgi:hypothetical protein
MNKNILYMLFATFLLTNSINSQVDKTWTGAGTTSTIPFPPTPNTNFTVYANDDNWDPGGVPADIDNITIPSGLANYPTAAADVIFATMTLESGATFINEGTVTGTITYKRTLSDANNWHLISSPVSGETIEDIKDQGKLAAGNNGNIGFASYTNRNGGPWIYETTTENTSVLLEGKGYSIKLKEGLAVKDVSFTGTVGTDNITYTTGGGTGRPKNNYSLVGNPFTAYMNATTFFNANIGQFSEQTLWLWNGTAYVTYNNTDLTFELAPTQGFFVDVSGDGLGGVTITFAKLNQSHQTTDTFPRQEPHPNFKLFVENESAKSATKVFYIDGKTTGFDNGYDSKMFGGVEYGFSVFTELVSDNEGNKLAIQTLPKNDASIIPVGVIANAGEEITFSIESTNLPEGVSVSLEDKKIGVFTNLSETTYTTTLTEAANGVGQFYIHTAGNVLNTTDLNIENISIYKSSSNEITITGLNTEATFTMFSLLGKQVLQTKVTANGVSKVNLPSLSTGIYILKLNSSLGTITKKITFNQQ